VSGSVYLSMLLLSGEMKLVMVTYVNTHIS